MARKRTSSKRPGRKATAGKAAAAAKAGAGESKPAAARRAGRPSALLDTRIVHCGDCLDQLGKLPDGCVDLIYIDPPFNSNRNYEVFWGETKEKRAFEDRHASTQPYIEFVGCVLTHHPLGASRRTLPSWCTIQSLRRPRGANATRKSRCGGALDYELVQRLIQARR